MGIGQTFPRRNNFVSGFLGVLGISLVLFGIQQASKPATDEFGRVLIIGGSLLSYGAWRFWPVSKPERTHHTTDHEPYPTSAERFPAALAGMSIIMTIVWSMMFTTGDDDLFWTWVVLSPVYLIFLGHNFLLRDGMVEKSIPFTASYAIACIIWIIFLYIHGDPWFWRSGLFTMIMWLSILPPLSLALLNESLNTSSEKQSLNRIGIVASVPFCVTGIYGVIFFIPTLILLSLGMVLKPRLMIRNT
tara:strand:+ start:823 stop:1560 length:738 start_codon:yes stop_codon:yes gene_type:complete